MSFTLDESHVRVQVPARDWEGAIQEAGELLVSAGSISREYIGHMIQAVKDMGPYIVLMPKLALAHAAPCRAVRKSDISLITLREPVDFGSPNGPVSVVLCLACADRTQHMDRLAGIAEVLMRDGVIARLEQAADVKEVLAVLSEESA